MEEISQALEKLGIEPKAEYSLQKIPLSLARWGYHELFERIGNLMPRSNWINDCNAEIYGRANTFRISLQLDNESFQI